MVLVTRQYKRRLNYIKNGVINKFGKGKPSHWRNVDFKDLSFEIKLASNILISASTLKRIFGKNKTPDTYYPQESTLEAMGKYADVHADDEKTIFLFLKNTYFLLLAVFVLIVGILWFYGIFASSSEKLIPVKLELQKVDGANPATAIFHYEIPDTEDSLFISFGDGYPLKHLVAEKKLISHYYKYPGIFNITICTRKQVLSDTLKLFIGTDDWQTLAHYYQQNHNERYFPIPLEYATNAEEFHPTRKILANIGMDTTRIIVLRLDNFRQTGKNGDAFQLKTRLKNISYWPAVRCYSAYIHVVGRNGSIKIKLANEGCSQYGNVTLSEKTIQGIYADLSNFSLDIKNWNEIEIINNNKQVDIKINSTTIFHEAYNTSIGELMGVTLKFHGSGYVDYFILQDKGYSPIFEKQFCNKN